MLMQGMPEIADWSGLVIDFSILLKSVAYSSSSDRHREHIHSPLGISSSVSGGLL